jgi:hypothetical protein
MADGEFSRGEIDTQFLERRGDLMAGAISDDHAVVAAVAAALAEEEARQRRRPRPGGDGETGNDNAWTRAGRLEGLR